MKAKDNKDCGERHALEFFRDHTAIVTIGDRRYTICSHRVGRSYCGNLIDVTDGNVVFCCGDETSHHNDVIAGLD